MFMKGEACFLFLDPQDEFGPSISSSVVQCSFVLLVYIVVFKINFNIILINFNVKNRRTSRIQIPMQHLKQLQYTTILANIFKPSAIPC